MINDYYEKVLAAVHDADQSAADIARTSLPPINSMPRERSEFDLSDVVAMLGHLCELGLVRVNRQEQERNGSVVGVKNLYSLAHQSPQMEIFETAAEPDGGAV